MPFQDSDAERRNLMVTSVAFIAYYYGGGRFINNTVTLQVINAEFSRPWVLGLIAWIAFFWFVFCYWQKHRGKFKPSFVKFTKDLKIRGHIKSYLLKRAERADETLTSFVVNGTVWRTYCLVGQCRVTRGKGIPIALEETVYLGKPAEEQVEFKCNDFAGLYISAKALAVFVVYEPGFSRYLAPYILTCIAIPGPLVSMVFLIPS